MPAGTTNHSQFELTTEKSVQSRGVGISTVYIWNCHGGRLPVRIWSYDFTTRQWQYYGEIASQWSGGTFGGCGSITSAPGMTVSLQDGHKYSLQAFDQNGVHAWAEPVTGGTTNVWAWNIG